jgi:hypothetical protein
MAASLTPAAKWILAMMTGAAPPDNYAKMVQMPGWEETVDQRKARYEEIATAIAEVAFDPNEKPLWTGVEGRSKTAALLVSVAYHESEFAKDVDVGPCYRVGNRSQRCDGGRAACMLQINVGERKTAEGWTKAELFADRKKCFRAGLSIMRGSFASCASLGQAFLLNSYASGTCARGHERSQPRMDFQTVLLGKHKRAWKDDATQLLPAKKDDKK